MQQKLKKKKQWRRVSKFSARARKLNQTQIQQKKTTEKLHLTGRGRLRRQKHTHTNKNNKQSYRKTNRARRCEAKTKHIIARSTLKAERLWRCRIVLHSPNCIKRTIAVAAAAAAVDRGGAAVAVIDRASFLAGLLRGALDRETAQRVAHGPLQHVKRAHCRSCRQRGVVAAGGAVKRMMVNVSQQQTVRSGGGDHQ